MKGNRLEASYKKIREANQRDFPRFSVEEYKRRYQRIREEMGRRNLDCLIIYGNSTVASHGHANVRWVSNYADVIQSYVVFPLKESPTLFNTVHSQVPLAVSMSVLEDVRHGGDTNEMPNAVVRRIKELGLENAKIGICGGDIRLCSSIPHNHYLTFQSNLPNVTFLDATDLLQALRRIPSEEEVEWFEKGAALTDYAMDCLAKAIRPGVRGYELYGAIHSHLDRGGHPMFALVGSTPMANPTMSYPWYVPSNRAIEKGDIVITELSASYWGYGGQLCRVVAVGEPTKEYQNLYKVALDVYKSIRRF